MNRFLYIHILLIVCVASGFASLRSSKLLPLVPSGSEIVAGFENYPDPHRHGQLLLTTHNNRLDLEDWLALVGVDNKRVLNEAIEVAASSSGGLLTEHLLLVAGRFDRDHIYSAAELNAAKKTECEGQTVMLIEPFSREKGSMQDIRWLLILENRIGMLGSPAMVRDALHRFLTHADVDMPLMERLAQLDSDISSWNVLVSTLRTGIGYTVAQPTSPRARLMKDADVLMIGAHFGSKIRIDFSLHAKCDQGAEFFEQKAASFAEVFAAKPPHPSPSSRAPQHEKDNPSLEPNHAQGSIELSLKEFQIWSEQANHPQRPLSQAAAHGE
jgi:hypothetical protein